jgi:ribosomal protein L11 methyltransferase
MERTQDCLRFILREDLHGKKVLDRGTGAGLLSVAAALAGAEHVLAVDIEDVAAEVSYNASLNGVENRISILKEDVLSPSFQVDGLFDWILANIAANEIMHLTAFLKSHLAPNGTLLLSGMVEWNYQETLNVFQDTGFQVNQITKTDEWVTALVTKSKHCL